MAFFLLLAATAWGYRHWSLQGDRRLLAGTGSALHLDRLEEEEPPHRAGHRNLGLRGGDPSPPQPVVSPYRMNPGYRRPRPGPGTDSDHGYSTMTPFGDQDSEIMSCLGEPVRRQAVEPGSQPKARPEVAGLVAGEAAMARHEMRPEVPGATSLVSGQMVVAALVHMVDT
jgi:hypothetical protein